MKHRIYVVGMGPGQENMMTQEALQVLEASDVIEVYKRQARMKAERKNMVLQERSEQDPLTRMANRFRLNDYAEEMCIRDRNRSVNEIKGSI